MSLQFYCLADSIFVSIFLLQIIMFFGLPVVLLVYTTIALNQEPTISMISHLLTLSPYCTMTITSIAYIIIQPYYYVILKWVNKNTLTLHAEEFKTWFALFYIINNVFWFFIAGVVNDKSHIPPIIGVTHLVVTVLGLLLSWDTFKYPHSPFRLCPVLKAERPLTREQKIKGYKKYKKYKQLLENYNNSYEMFHNNKYSSDSNIYYERYISARNKYLKHSEKYWYKYQFYEKYGNELGM